MSTSSVFGYMCEHGADPAKDDRRQHSVHHLLQGARAQPRRLDDGQRERQQSFVAAAVGQVVVLVLTGDALQMRQEVAISVLEMLAALVPLSWLQVRIGYLRSARLAKEHRGVGIPRVNTVALDRRQPEGVGERGSARCRAPRGTASNSVPGRRAPTAAATFCRTRVAQVARTELGVQALLTSWRRPGNGLDRRSTRRGAD